MSVKYRACSLLMSRVPAKNLKYREVTDISRPAEHQGAVIRPDETDTDFRALSESDDDAF